MFERYQIEFDAKDTLAALDLTKKDLNKIAKKMMSGTFQAVRRDIRKGLRGQILKKQSGELYKSITYKARNDYSGFIRVGQYYAGFHEEGANVVPRKGAYLRFQIDGEWKTVRSVVLPKRQFAKPVVESYFSGNKAEVIMDSVMQRELEKIFNKD